MPTVLINAATVSVAYARQLARQVAEGGAGYVAAPVLGRPDMAAAAQLNIDCRRRSRGGRTMCGLRWMRSARKSGRWAMRRSAPNVVKLAANFMLASAIEAMAEACAFTRAQGVSRGGFPRGGDPYAVRRPGLCGLWSAHRRRSASISPRVSKMQLGLKDVAGDWRW